MTFGLTVNGDGNSLLFSTATDNLFFQGKATLAQIYDPNTIDYVFYDNIWLLFNWPDANFYRFTINLPASTTSILPFIYNSIGKRVGIASVSKVSSTTWDILVLACTNPNVSQPAISSSTYVPTIYVFSSYIDAAINTGNGINVFNESGQPIFTTNERPLILKALYSGNVPYSNLTAIREFGGNLSYVGNGPDRNSKYISYFSPLSISGSISKPAIFYSYGQTCTLGITIWECTAAFNSSTSQLAVEWAQVGQRSIFDPPFPTRQSTVSPFFAFIIDASLYD
jgi:hypothetical protein